jgi:hypothetical protein
MFGASRWLEAIAPPDKESDTRLIADANINRLFMSNLSDPSRPTTTPSGDTNVDVY